MDDDLPTERQLLSRISRQLDILTLVMLDIKRDLVGAPEVSDEELAGVADLSSPAPQAEKPNVVGAPHVIEDGSLTIIRQPLPGKHWLIARVHTATSELESLQLELPGEGGRHDVTLGDVERTFGIAIRLPQPITPTEHPTDRALNPEIANGDDDA